MKILAVETSTKKLGIAIADQGTILGEHKGKGELRHCQDLVPNINKLLKDLSLKLTDLDGFAISIGPGSFTGLRVGVSILKGLNIATDIPIISVPTLDVIAHNAKDSTIPICVIIDARKNNLYTCCYRRRMSGIIKLWDYSLLPADELIKKIKEEAFFIGDGIALYREAIDKSIKGARFADEREWFPDVKVVARLGMEQLKEKRFEDPDAIVPMYMYSKECNVKGIGR